jgi:hypothetical protein
MVADPTGQAPRAEPPAALATNQRDASDQTDAPVRMAWPALGDSAEEAPSGVATQMRADVPRPVALSVARSLAPFRWMGAAETSQPSLRAFLSEESRAA